MIFFVVLLVLIVSPIVVLTKIGNLEFENAVFYLFVAISGWILMIRGIREQKLKKRIKTRRTKRTEDDFLNEYGYIDNSAFKPIKSFINHDNLK